MVGGQREIEIGHRAFAITQDLFGGAPAGASRRLTAGWHDTGAHPETGAFAVVRRDAGLDDLIGDIVRVTYAGRHVFVYVLEAADVPVDFSLTRRYFAALARLTTETARCEVVVV